MINLDEFSYDELVELNHQIVERLKALDTAYALMDMAALNIGDRVSFRSKTGKQIGHIVKFNTKTVGVLTESGRRWNVSPHLLTKVNDVPADKKIVKLNARKKQKRRKR